MQVERQLPYCTFFTGKRRNVIAIGSRCESRTGYFTVTACCLYADQITVFFLIKKGKKNLNSTRKKAFTIGWFLNDYYDRKVQLSLRYRSCIWRPLSSDLSDRSDNNYRM